MRPEIGRLRSFSEGVLANCQREPARPLLADQRGGLLATAFAGRVAAAISRLVGILRGRQRVVFVVCDEQCGFVSCLVALNHLAQIVVPIYRACAPHELRELLRVYQPALVISPDAPGPTLDACIRWIRYDELMAEPGRQGDAPAAEHRRDDAALIMFTSGSSGLPKGVVLTNENVLANVASVQGYMRLGSDDACVICRSLTHASALVCELLLTMLTGGTAHLRGTPKTISRLFDWCDADGVSWVAMTPALLRLVVGYVRTSRRRLEVRRIVASGSIMSSDLCIACLDALPEVELINAYGLTEASPRVAALPPHLARTRSGAVGFPIAGCEVQIVDERGRACGPAEVGELRVAGPNVMRGYFPEGLDPNCEEIGWLSTGDAAYRDHDGALYIVGRLDGMVLHNGVNVYPEAVCGILEQCRVVRRAALANVDCGPRGERFVAFVELENDLERAGALASLRRHLAEHLDPRKHPDEVVAMSPLPVLRSGKIDRGQLVRQYLRRLGLDHVASDQQGMSDVVR